MRKEINLIGKIGLKAADFCVPRDTVANIPIMIGMIDGLGATLAFRNDVGYLSIPIALACSIGSRYVVWMLRGQLND